MNGLGVTRADGALVFDEFEEGDPRRVISPEELAEAGVYMAAKKRWHLRRPEVDWFAVELQYGRGIVGIELARPFLIGESSVRERRDRQRWICLMSGRDRRRLSQCVWLAGIWRGQGDDPKSRAALKASSEWRLPEEAAPSRFKLLDPKGAPLTATFNQEIPNDVYYSAADPKRDDRFAMRRELDDLIACAERDLAEEQTPETGEAAPEMAGDARGLAESTPAQEMVGAVGAAEPASA